MEDKRLQRFQRTEELIARGARLVETGDITPQFYRESVEMLCAIQDACDNGTDRELVDTAKRWLAWSEQEWLRIKWEQS